VSAPTSKTLHFVHPGPVSQMSGGTRYDIRVIDEMQRMGWDIALHQVAGRFPVADRVAAAGAAALLADIPDGDTVAFDGLALPAFDGALDRHAARLVPLAIVHHPTADETGLTESESARLFEIETRLFASLRRIVVPSPAMVRRLAAFGVAAGRIAVAEPGIDPVPRAAGSDGGAVALLCVATLTPRKGHVALLEALSDCMDLDWTLVCAGPTDSDPPTTAAVEDAIRRFGMTDRVRLVGTQVGPDLDALYDAADVFVLASRYEGYGMVFAEAIARGLPVVASGDGAVRDTVPEAAGVVVPVGDRSTLASALRRMIADTGFRRGKADGAWAAGRALPRWSDTAACFADAIAAAQAS
jgi:glycosyltransferase involved in cell wall biosynthesis